jgi:hypothetical protein
MSQYGELSTQRSSADKQNDGHSVEPQKNNPRHILISSVMNIGYKISHSLIFNPPLSSSFFPRIKCTDNSFSEINFYRCGMCLYCYGMK